MLFARQASPRMIATINGLLQHMVLETCGSPLMAHPNGEVFVGRPALQDSLGGCASVQDSPAGCALEGGTSAQMEEDEDAQSVAYGSDGVSLREAPCPSPHVKFVSLDDMFSNAMVTYLSSVGGRQGVVEPSSCVQTPKRVGQKPSVASAEKDRG